MDYIPSTSKRPLECLLHRHLHDEITRRLEAVLFRISMCLSPTPCSQGRGLTHLVDEVCEGVSRSNHLIVVCPYLASSLPQGPANSCRKHAHVHVCVHVFTRLRVRCMQRVLFSRELVRTNARPRCLPCTRRARRKRLAAVHRLSSGSRAAVQQAQAQADPFLGCGRCPRGKAQHTVNTHTKNPQTKNL